MVPVPGKESGQKQHPDGNNGDDQSLAVQRTSTFIHIGDAGTLAFSTQACNRTAPDPTVLCRDRLIMIEKLQSICVYCGSSSRVDERYKRAAAWLGRAMAERGVTLIYGGGRVGLMGVIADAALPLLTARRLVDRLRILRPDIQVIYTSADGDPSNAGEAGARFLQKPFGVTALLSTVEAMLGQPHQRA